MHTDDVNLQGDVLHVAERLILAPATGVFSSVSTSLAPGDLVAIGDTVGVIASLAERIPVVSPHRGAFMGLLALQAQRVRNRQPVAWLRLVDR